VAAELLRGPPVATPHQPVLAVAVPAPAQPIDVSKWPKMDLVTFCERFEISGGLCDKLVGLGVQGPHVLHFIKDEDLRAEGHLLLGELGTFVMLRNAGRTSALGMLTYYWDCIIHRLSVENNCTLCFVSMLWVTVLQPRK